jgi:hypothetical protein
MNHLERNEKKRNRLRTLIDLKKWYANPENGYIDPNKWKIRGWKRRVEYLNRWGNDIQKPYTGFLKITSGYNTDRPGSYPYMRERYAVYPWYNFYKHRQPPLWFFKIIIGYFVSAFDKWDTTFAEYNEPYDVFIQIYDPHFIESEIHCVKMEEEGDRYDYWPVSEITKPFPFNKFGSSAYDLSKFDWELRIEEDIVDDDFEYNGWNETKLFKNGYVKHAYEDRAYYTKPIGDVWVGRKKNEQ